MSDFRSLCAEAWAAGLEPEPELTISEWAEQYRVLSGRATAEPGPWRTERTPYLREIMDALSPSSDTEMVVFMKGAQVGATECGNNFLGFVIHHAPGPMLYVQPTVEMAKRVSRQRIAPMIEACPPLRERVEEPRSRDSGNTILAKEFPGGILILTGANSAVGLRSMPARYLFLDEIDGYPFDVDGEGDPVELARKRTSTFSANRKVFLVSTPTVKGLSRIEAAFEQTDQRYYHVPCPHCGLYQPIRWAQICWPAGEPEKAQMVCEGCTGEIPEHQKTRMLEQGRWVPTAEGKRGLRGYHLSSLYSPVGWYSWADAATDFLKAKHAGDELVKTWMNTVLAETWEEHGETLDDGSLFGRRETYAAEVPADAVVLTAGIDIQDDRIEMEIVGWGPGEESWGVDYKVLWGDPGRQDLWDDLAAELEQSYQHENGSKLRVAAACIDSGGHHTQAVYEFCRGRSARRIFAIRGAAGAGRPIVSAPLPKRSGRNRRPVQLFIVGVDEAKALIYSRLRIQERGPGFCHFPVKPQYEAEYFAQLTAEKIMTRYHRGFPKREWVKTRPRNEALDCRVYALAALYLFRPHWGSLKRRVAPAPPESEGQEKRVEKRVVRRPRVGMPGGWVDSWRWRRDSNW
ncbi:MAG: phage terminase large subunit family protein [Candidatus Eisenbacteria bacterium]